ncbi:septum site-determining protein MinC [Thermoflavimicrobium daqui]|jgi:septum site-determining protein MinC|uniref:Probable septum site-determining protein MinC n=1 Tax=Thermoflavimicrobium daqui TaxID=2137476 RepID=A0A364K8X1_9BACL|nr:septum site-determining protein MinC [Thermoflavimicrobium daqui]RAL26650.1 septum site-determining protein MinC [Thermoflavimicrobium daqui]
MGKVRPGVTIKGTKDGLLFILNDSCPFSRLLEELKQLLEYNHSSLWNGPDTKVLIKLGKRQITKPEEIALRQLFATKKNLLIQGFESEESSDLLHTSGVQMLAGTVRSGQILTHKGDLLLLGDVNPGGCVQSTGSIFVLGSLRGLAHAGSNGDETALIAASIFKPTQIRITDVISRPPDEWDESEVGMRFAYLINNQIAVDQVQSLSQLRPDMKWKENGRQRL